MATPNETFVLAQVAGPAADAEIVCIIRAYLSMGRAQEDCDLLQESTTCCYRILTISYIDN